MGMRRERRGALAITGLELDVAGGGYAKKGCPRCGQLLYADMEVCYGCLYDFRRKDNGPSEVAAALDEPDGLGDACSGPGPAVAKRGAEDRAGAGGGDRAGAGGGGGTAPAAPPAPGPGRALGGEAGAAPSLPAAPPRALPDDEVTTVLDDARGERPAHAVWVRTPVADVLVPLGDEGLNIGRGSGNQVVIHAKSVSRRHLRLIPADGGVEAIDLGATNPARYRGACLTGPVVVPWGDAVQVGEASLVMQP